MYTFSVKYRSCSLSRSMPHVTSVFSNFARPAFISFCNTEMASVYSSRLKGVSTMALRRSLKPSFFEPSKNSKSSAHRHSAAATQYFR